MTLAPAVQEDRPRRYTAKLNGKPIGKARLERVPVHIIKVDSAYQRDVSKTWVHAHLPWDEKKAGTVVLSGRAGGPYCIDGQHRLELAREAGISYLNSFVIEGLTQRDEAGLFVGYQRDRRNLTSWSLFRAETTAGDVETLDMIRVANVVGYRLTNQNGPNNITAIDAVRRVIRLGGESLLLRTLRTIREHWTGEEKATSGQLVYGIALFLASVGERPQFDVRALDRIMEATAPLKLIRLSQAVAERRKAVNANSAANVAEALLELYNKSFDKRPDLQIKEPLTISGKRRPAPRGTAR